MPLPPELGLLCPRAQNRWLVAGQSPADSRTRWEPGAGSAVGGRGEWEELRSVGRARGCVSGRGDLVYRQTHPAPRPRGGLRSGPIRAFLWAQRRHGIWRGPWRAQSLIIGSGCVPPSVLTRVWPQGVSLHPARTCCAPSAPRCSRVAPERRRSVGSPESVLRDGSRGASPSPGSSLQTGDWGAQGSDRLCVLGPSGDTA